MKIKCQFCDTMIDDTLDQCPFCGGPNPNVVRTTKDQPQTIEELKAWYEKRGLPPYETTRFFIGENYTKPRAFGIYKDEQGNFVVYKNKDSGQRAVRYKGTDEAYAVNELFMRLKQEIIEQKRHNLGNGQNSGGSNSDMNSDATGSIGSAKSIIKGLFSFFVIGGAAIFGLILIIGVLLSFFDDSPDKGYYKYGDAYYYNISGNSYSGWYYFDDYYYDWEPANEADIPQDLKTNDTAKDFYYTPSWDASTQVTDFEDTPLYEEYIEEHQNDNSSDSSDDYSWDSSDSWDSDYSDFDSDW